jgi:hypothetical protein
MSEGDSNLEAIIGHLGLDLFDDDTRAEVERLLAKGQTVEPGARQKLIGAAQRAIQLHSLDQATFEVLAFETRQAKPVDIEALALVLRTDADTVRKLERGELPIQSQSPSLFAAWIVQLGIEESTALESLRRSLRRTARRAAYALADEDVVLDETATEYIDSVRDALRGRGERDD